MFRMIRIKRDDLDLGCGGQRCDIFLIDQAAMDAGNKKEGSKRCSNCVEEAKSGPGLVMCGTLELIRPPQPSAKRILLPGVLYSKRSLFKIKSSMAGCQCHGQKCPGCFVISEREEI